MKKYFLILLVIVLLAGCQPSPDQLSQLLNQTLQSIPTSTPYPSNTPYPTYTAYPSLTPVHTATVYPTYTKVPTLKPVVVIVTATSSPTPEFTPTETQLPTPTVDPLKAVHTWGFYLVGSEIAPGTWRSLANMDKCYWAVLTKENEIIDNYYGAAGGIMFIPSTAYVVELGKYCGNWEYQQ